MEYIESAQIVLPCVPLDENVSFFKDRLGFRVDVISPADDPSVVVMSGYGLRLRLERNHEQSSAILRLFLKDQSDLWTNESSELIAPNGTKIQLVKETKRLAIPDIRQSFVISRMSDNAQWVKGRAGMNYRDLIPGRQGGRFIASHIQINDGGPVPDHVHYHQIRFQMIYVYKGWVRLLYEDQGEDFVLQSGDCVLQPPLIRHRVLESSSGLEVVEIACPAVHDTFIDHQIELPTKNYLPARNYGGQRFVKYISSEDKMEWQPWRLSSFQCRDLGIGEGTEGLAGVKIIRTNGHLTPQLCQHQAEFVFIFILDGELTFNLHGQTEEKLRGGDALVIPENVSYSFNEGSNDLCFLEVSLPAAFPTTFQ